MRARDLALLLDEANPHPWEGVRSTLAGVDAGASPQVAWLVDHLRDTKREYWALIAQAAGTPPPPAAPDLAHLMTWEVQAARALPEAALTQRLTPAGAAFTVAELLRLNARHTTWHAGQIAALVSGARAP